MKEGDIIYFKSELKVPPIPLAEPSPGLISVTYDDKDYLYKPGDRYLIHNLPTKLFLGEMKNLEDNTLHWMDLDHLNQMITLEEWRKLQIDKIITQ